MTRLHIVFYGFLHQTSRNTLPRADRWFKTTHYVISTMITMRLCGCGDRSWLLRREISDSSSTFLSNCVPVGSASSNPVSEPTTARRMIGPNGTVSRDGDGGVGADPAMLARHSRPVGHIHRRSIDNRQIACEIQRRDPQIADGFALDVTARLASTTLVWWPSLQCTIERKKTLTHSLLRVTGCGS